ncbi:MAG: HAD-IB family hydrolase [Myxococcales bacterium]|nr:HAD-IB family hydrolase [Myxococcales bacterium]
MKIAAFFDFDKTLLRVDSASIGFRYLWERREISAGYLLKVAVAGQLYRRDWLSMEAISELCLRFYKGRRLAEFTAGAQEYCEKYLKPYLSPIILAKIEEHRRAGHYLVLLSASVDYYVEWFGRELDFNRVICSRLAEDDAGFLTGRSVGPLFLGKHKKTAAESLAHEEGIDLRASFAYADHHSDLPLLESVGHPVVIRPSRPLRAEALRRGWPILAEE